MFKILNKYKIRGQGVVLDADTGVLRPGIPAADYKAISEIEKLVRRNKESEVEAKRVDMLVRERPMLKKKAIFGVSVLAFIIAEFMYSRHLAKMENWDSIELPEIDDKLVSEKK